MCEPHSRQRGGSSRQRELRPTIWPGVISETGHNANMPFGIVASVSPRNSRARDEVCRRRDDKAGINLDSFSPLNNFCGGDRTPEEDQLDDRQRMTPMLDENLARLRTHRNNISRYRRLLQTSLTALERDFIEQRLSEEEAAWNRLASDTFPIALSLLPDMPPSQAA